MDWMMFLAAVAAIAAVIALIAVPYTVIGYFRANPKRQLLYSVSTRPLITNADVPRVKVIIDGQEIANPYFVEFRMISTSRADIPSSLFDAGSQIDIELDAQAVIVSQVERGIEIASWEVDGWPQTIAHLDPQLIKRGASLAIDFVTDGDESIEVRAPLIDVKVKQVSDRRALQVFAEGVLESGLLPFSGVLSALRRAPTP